MAVQKSISIIVIDGELSALPALATMQDSGVLLRDASWDIRKSTTGLSVSIFWPSAVTGRGNSKSLNPKPKRIRNRRLRRKKHPVEVKPVLLPLEECQLRASVSPSPTNAHLLLHNPSSPVALCLVMLCRLSLLLMLLRVLEISLRLLVFHSHVELHDP